MMVNYISIVATTILTIFGKQTGKLHNIVQELQDSVGKNHQSSNMLLVSMLILGVL